MLYVAWADGDLAPEEVGEVCRRVSATAGLEGGCREILGRWLDAEQPPTARELRELLTAPGATGVGIEDCGEKLGLNGVDNGRLWFDQVRVLQGYEAPAAES